MEKKLIKKPHQQSDNSKVNRKYADIYNPRHDLTLNLRHLLFISNLSQSEEIFSKKHARYSKIFSTSVDELAEYLVKLNIITLDEIKTAMNNDQLKRFIE